MLISVLQSQKLVAVLATSTSITEKKTEEKKELEQASCMQYPITFKDLTEDILDSRSKVNVISQVFAY